MGNILWLLFKVKLVMLICKPSLHFFHLLYKACKGELIEKVRFTSNFMTIFKFQRWPAIKWKRAVLDLQFPYVQLCPLPTRASVVNIYNDILVFLTQSRSAWWLYFCWLFVQLKVRKVNYRNALNARAEQWGFAGWAPFVGASKM